MDDDDIAAVVVMLADLDPSRQDDQQAVTDLADADQRFAVGKGHLLPNRRSRLISAGVRIGKAWAARVSMIEGVGSAMDRFNRRLRRRVPTRRRWTDSLQSALRRALS
jgi:hypothetical protein